MALGAGLYTPIRMGKCVRVLKYTLFGFNLLFWAVGCSVIAIGIYFHVHNIYGALFKNFPSLTIANVFILFGCVIMVFGFLGCMGAIKENKCLLLTFFILLLMILLMEVILAIILFLHEKEIQPYITKQLTSSFEEHKTESKYNETIWDTIQENLKCCGVKSSKDWEDSIPKSCCPVNINVCTIENTFKLGCLEIIKDWFEKNFVYVGIVIICTSIVEVLAMSFALTLYCHISRSSGSLST